MHKNLAAKTAGKPAGTVYYWCSEDEEFAKKVKAKERTSGLTNPAAHEDLMKRQNWQAALSHRLKVVEDAYRDLNPAAIVNM